MLSPVALWLLHDINSVFSNVLICFLVEPRCLQHITRKQCIPYPGDHLALKQVFLVISTYPHPAAVSLENSKIAACSGEKFSEKMKSLSCITCFSFLCSEITNLTIACVHLSILSNCAHSTLVNLLFRDDHSLVHLEGVFLVACSSAWLIPLRRELNWNQLISTTGFVLFVFLANVNAWEFYLPVTKLHFKIGLRYIA